METCPKCSASVGEAEKECPSCGIFFSKWREREENVASGNTLRYASLATATSSEFNWTILLIFCAAIVGVGYFLLRRAGE